MGGAGNNAHVPLNKQEKIYDIGAQPCFFTKKIPRAQLEGVLPFQASTLRGSYGYITPLFKNAVILKELPLPLPPFALRER